VVVVSFFLNTVECYIVWTTGRV